MFLHKLAEPVKPLVEQGARRKLKADSPGSSVQDRGPCLRLDDGSQLEERLLCSYAVGIAQSHRDLAAAPPTQGRRRQDFVFDRNDLLADNRQEDSGLPPQADLRGTDLIRKKARRIPLRDDRGEIERIRIDDLAQGSAS